MVALYPFFMRLRHMDFPITPIPINPILVFSGFIQTQRAARAEQANQKVSTADWNKHGTHPDSPPLLILALATLPRGLGVAHPLIDGPSAIELLSLGRFCAGVLSARLPSVQALSMQPQNFSRSSSQGCSQPPSASFPRGFSSALKAKTWPSEPSFDTAKNRLLFARACSRASSNDAPATPPW